MKKKSLVSATWILSCCCAMYLIQLANGQTNAPSHTLTHAGELKWEPSFMGCEHANVSGDPSAEGKPFVLRIRCPDGAKIPIH